MHFALVIPLTTGSLLKSEDVAAPTPPAYINTEEELMQRAVRGEPEAQYWLGWQLSLGAWGTADEDKGQYWIHQSAVNGFMPACRILANLYYKQPPPDVRRLLVIGCLNHAAGKGDAACQTTLASLLIESPAPQAKKTAVKWLHEAMKSGFAPAMTLWGNWLAKGTAGPLNEMQAAEAYLKAAFTGSYEAAFYLSELYLRGGSLKANAHKAELWLRHACYGGEPMYLAALSMLLAHHPDEALRQPEESLILAQEAEAWQEMNSHPDILFSLACALQANARTEDALNCLGRTRQALESALFGPCYVTTALLAECESAWKAKRSWAPAYLQAKPGGEPLQGEIISPNSPHLRWWIKPAPPPLADPLPVAGIPQPPPLEQPTWTGMEPQIYDEWGEATVTLPTLLPADEMEIYRYTQENQELAKRANEGDLAAAHEMAMMMLNVPNNDELRESGLSVLNRLVEAGYAPSVRTLGWLHSAGYVLEKDESKAFSLFYKAGMAGDAEGLFHAARGFEYGLGTSINPPTAMILLRRAVVHGHLAAHDLLAVKLLEIHDSPVDSEAALNLFWKAAGHGYPESQYRLAWLYSVGRWVDIDLETSVFWATRAARQGHEKAQFLLAMRLMEGKGCEKDPAAAAGYLLSAAQSPYLPAMRKMADLYQMGSPLPADARRAEAWLRRAAHLGDALDKARLAEFLAIGMEGVTRQPEEAEQILNEAMSAQNVLDEPSQIEFLKVTAQAYAGLEKWNYAMDQERLYLARLSRPPLNQHVTYPDLQEASLERQRQYFQGSPLPLRSAVTAPDAQPLPADTILQESEDKLIPPKKDDQPKGPGWDIPWGLEV